MVQATHPLAHAIAALRLSLRTQQQRAGGPATSSPRAPKGAAGASSASPSKVATLAAGLAAIDPEDPHRRRKAIRAFIEATLQDEFGSALIMSADFQSTVDRTVDTLLSDESLVPLIDAAVAELGMGTGKS